MHNSERPIRGTTHPTADALTTRDFDFTVVFFFTELDRAAVRRLPACDGPEARHASEANAATHRRGFHVRRLGALGLGAELSGRGGLIDGEPAHSTLRAVCLVDNLWISHSIHEEFSFDT